jgi:hypothetical protein
MRVPLGDLEEARRNPAAFKRKQQEAGDEKKGGYGYYNLLLDSIMHFHKEGLTAAEGEREIVRRYDKLARLKSERAVEKIIEWFREYAADYARLAPDMSLTRVQVALQLPEQFSTLQVSGQLPRVDRTAEGNLVACVFSKEPRAWDQELRLPLIQEAVAHDLHANLEEVSVAAYCFPEGKHRTFQFSEAQIATSREELYRVLDQLL